MKQVYLILTKDCNLSCDFCIRDYSHNIEYFLDIRKLDLILTEIEKNFSNINLILSGGEPTLHSDFHIILSKACERFLNITINTNGTTNYFESTIFKELINKYKITIQISIDGYRGLHNSIRGLNAYDKSIETIRHLSVFDNISLVIASTVSSKSFLNSFNKLYSDVSLISNVRWDIKRVSYSGRANSLDFCYLTNDDWNTIVDKVEELDTLNLVHIYKTFDFNFLDNISDDIIRTLEKTTIKNCGSGTEKIYIYPNLDVLACTCYENNPSGNLNNEKLDNILKSRNHLNIINQTIDNKTCNDCRYKVLCNGGCLGSGYSTYRKHNIADIKCPKIYK